MVSELECFFHKLQKKGTFLSKIDFFTPFFRPTITIFRCSLSHLNFHILIPSSTEGLQMELPPGWDGLRVCNGASDSRNRARGDGNIHLAAEKGNLPALRHFLREDPGSMGEKTRHGRSLKISSIASGCRFGARRNPTFWSLVLTCVNRNLDSCSMLVYCIFGLELADLLQRSEGNH